MSYLHSNVKQAASTARRSSDKNIIPQNEPYTYELSTFVDLFPAIPAEMKRRDQWIVFTLSRPVKGKQNKIPCNPQSGKASDDQDTGIWMTYTDAVKALRHNPGRFKGIGYVFVKDDPFAGVDLDDCYHDGALDERAGCIVTALNSYTEISISGRGVKAIVRANVLDNPQCVDGVEVYGHSRFFALTGNHLSGTPLTITDASAALQSIIQQYGKPTAAPLTAPAASSDTSTIIDNPIAAYNQRISVIDVIERIGGRRDGSKLYHCPVCKCHKGKSGSLVVKYSAKYGAVVRGMNPACVFYGRDYAAFDVMKIADHDGDIRAAIHAAREELNMPIEREARPVVFSPKAPAPATARIVVNHNEVMNSVLLKMAKDDTLKKSERPARP